MKELTVDAAVENIAVVSDFISQELDRLPCPAKARTQLLIAIDELFGNIAHYAYAPDTGKATVRFEAQDDPPAVIITFIDSGVPFDPLQKTDPDTHLSTKDRPIGGLGIFIVKKSMNAVDYTYENGQNVLRIKKIIG